MLWGLDPGAPTPTRIRLYQVGDRLLPLHFLSTLCTVLACSLWADDHLLHVYYVGVVEVEQDADLAH